MGNGTVDIAIVGAGVAGMSAVLTAVERGARVQLISQDAPQRAGSACIREGIAAAVESSVGDSPALHAEDTLKCGAGLADEDAVRRMCDAAPAMVELLSRIGLTFDRTAEGLPRLSGSIGSSRSRVMSSGRSTGQRLLSVLAGQMARAEAMGRLSPFYGWEFLSLVKDDEGRVRGVVAQDLRNMEIRAFPADSVIICTGGYPALFAGHCSSNISDGAAIVACCEQGAAIANPEFVQSAPFAIEVGSKMRAVCDGALTQGGSVWVERDGKPWHFLREGGGLVSRDAAAISAVRALGELADGQLRGLRLDVTHLDPDFVYEYMAPLIEACEGTGRDPLREPIEVQMAVARTLGGLLVDGEHATTVENLFAAGSASCLYHGAGALGGNELLASLYGGTVAARAAVESARRAGDGGKGVPASLLTHAVEREEDVIARISAKEGTENAYAIAEELGFELWGRALIEKGNEDLARAAGKVEELASRLTSAQLCDRAEWCNTELAFHRRLGRRLLLANLYIKASVAREESRGCHHKPARPERNDKRWAIVTRATLGEDGFVLDHSGGES